MLWDFIDKTYIITLQTSMERQDRMRTHLKDIGISNYDFVYFKPVSPNTKNDVHNVNCSLLDIMNLSVVDEVSNNITKNHLMVIALAYKHNYERVLILEDDAEFTTPIPDNKIGIVSQWLRKNTCDLFYFGYCVWPIPLTICVAPHIVKIPSPYCAHSYIITREGMQKVLHYTAAQDIDNMNIHIDKLLATMPSLHKYACFPNICFQTEDPGLYKRAVNKILPTKWYVPFRYTVHTMDYISCILPIIVIFLICYIIIKSFFVLIAF